MKVENSYIELKGLRFHARHGVLPQEKVVGGDYVVNLRVHYNISKAMKTDDVNDTLNYALLLDIIKKEMAEPSNLLEHVAGRIGQTVIEHFDEVEDVTISITKLNPPLGARCAGATVEIHLINDKTL